MTKTFAVLPARVTTVGCARSAAVCVLSSDEILSGSSGLAIPGAGIFSTYSSSPPPISVPRPYQSRYLQLWAAHHSRDKYPGRRPRPVTRVVSTPPSPVRPYPQARLLQIHRSHLARTPFPGRTPPRPALVPYIPPAPSLPFLAIQRYLQTYSSHFRKKPFQPRRRYLPIYPGGSGLPSRASQIVAEALYDRSEGARATQLVLEALSSITTTARASQIVAETLLLAQPQFLASQIVVEVLVPYFAVVPMLVYPIGPQPANPMLWTGYNVVKEPVWSTGVATATSGKEARAQYWSTPRWKWTLTYEYLPDAMRRGITSSDLKTLLGFFMAVCGSGQGFYFQDVDDYIATAQTLGSTDGTTQSWLITRTYGISDLTVTEPVGGVMTAQPIEVYVGGELVSSSEYTIDTSTPMANYLNFRTPPAADQLVQMSFQFWYWARFMEDTISFEKFMDQLWQNQKVVIYSLKSY